MDRNILKKSTQSTAPPSVQGAIFHTKEGFEERKERSRKKETDFKMCSKEKQTQGSSLPSLLSGSFLCSYRKEQNDCGARSGEGETGVTE